MHLNGPEEDLWKPLSVLSRKLRMDLDISRSKSASFTRLLISAVMVFLSTWILTLISVFAGEKLPYFVPVFMSSLIILNWEWTASSEIPCDFMKLPVLCLIFSMSWRIGFILSFIKFFTDLTWVEELFQTIDFSNNLNKISANCVPI